MNELTLNGFEALRLLSAFQAMDITSEYGGRAFGVSNREACRIVHELTGIKPQGRGRIAPERLGDGEPLQRYINWLVATGKEEALA